MTGLNFTKGVEAGGGELIEESAVGEVAVGADVPVEAAEAEADAAEAEAEAEAAHNSSYALADVQTKEGADRVWLAPVLGFVNRASTYNTNEHHFKRGRTYSACQNDRPSQRRTRRYARARLWHRERRIHGIFASPKLALYGPE